MFLIEDIRVIGRNTNADDDPFVDLVVFPWSIAWNGLPIDDAGVFGGAGIQGRFYGSDHEEVGGVFLKDSISGAFGASR